jgi:CheY-like chemotaxis protein
MSDDMRSESILIVDDNESNLRLMEAILGGERYMVKSAMHAEEALRMLRNWRPRLILTDIQLPGIDGLELTRRLKRDPSYQTNAIVALTAYAMKGDEEKALAAGCDGYITKPVDTRILPRIIRRYLEIAARRRVAPKQSNRGRRKPAGAPR